MEGAKAKSGKIEFFFMISGGPMNRKKSWLEVLAQILHLLFKF